jgi:hypothetical protein
LSLIKDLQFSLRQLRKAKVFAVVAAVTLALGIGCNTAIFSVFYSVLLRPLPFSDPDRLVIVSERATNFPMLTASWLNYKDWKAQSTSFEEFGATRVVTMALTGTGQPEQVPGQMISGNLLHMLGVNAVAGRPISAVDDQPASPAVALLGYGLWQRRFGGAESVIGQTIILDRQTYIVIGVLSQGFELLQQAPDFIVAMAPWASKLPDDRSWHPGINAIARLKPSVSLSQARAEMSAIAKRLYAQYSTDNIAIDAIVNPMQAQLVGEVKPALTMLLGAVIFVLLIAIGNIANLMLTRATARRRDIAIRMSLGASDWTIIKQLIVEGLVLSLTGAVVGVALAYLLMPSLLHAAGGVHAGGRGPHRRSSSAVHCHSVDLRRCILRHRTGGSYSNKGLAHRVERDRTSRQRQTRQAAAQWPGGLGDFARAAVDDGRWALRPESESSVRGEARILGRSSAGRRSSGSSGRNRSHRGAPQHGLLREYAAGTAYASRGQVRRRHILSAGERTRQCDPFQHPGKAAAESCGIRYGELSRHEFGVFSGAPDSADRRPLD